MVTANSVMRDVWMNVESASGQMLTIERNYLYSLLLQLEKEQYDQGHRDGYQHGLLVSREGLPSDLDYEDLDIKW